jgi:flagellar basal-body rod protein FlgG
MMRALWVSKTGMDVQQSRLDVISHNLANVATNGYKAQRSVFEDLLYQTSIQPGALSSSQTQYSAGLQFGAGARQVANPRSFTQGNLEQTGNTLDVAVNGNGFFEIQMPDGSIAYTRDGSFQKDPNGQLVTQAGYPVSPGIVIPANALTVTIGKDGTVSVTTPGNVASAQVGQLQLSSFINPAGLQSMGGNLFGATSASGEAQQAAPGTNGMGVLNQSYVETSNVNVVEEMVNMIAAQRAYEINSKGVQAADQMLARLSQLGG